MKAINAKSERILRALIAKLDADGYAKVDAGDGYMPVSIERIGTVAMGDIFSIAHYGESNSDLMADPEMTVLVTANAGCYPLSYRNDFAGVDQNVIEWEDGKIKGYRPKLQRDLASFFGQWMSNVQQQQGLKLVA